MNQTASTMRLRSIQAMILALTLIAMMVICLVGVHSVDAKRSKDSMRAWRGHTLMSSKESHEYDAIHHRRPPPRPRHRKRSSSSSSSDLPASSKPPPAWSASDAPKHIYTGSFGRTVANPKSIEELPIEWDWCHTAEGRSFCTSSWNQHIPQYCGSCYVHGALHAANDRIKLLLDARNDVLLARQVILNCAPSMGLGEGCDGGEVYDVFEFMYRYGLPDESCQNYIARPNHPHHPDRCEAIDICMNCMPSLRNESKLECWAVETPIRYYVKEYGTVSGEQAIMNEIYERGPITCAFASVDDFDYNYRGGIYIDRTNATDSNHDVEVVGWGVDQETGIKYWKARNSWGENSFFKIIRGINNMRFEEECVFALFDVTDLEDVIGGRKRGGMFGLVKEQRPTVTEVGYKKSTHHREKKDKADDDHDDGSRAGRERLQKTFYSQSSVASANGKGQPSPLTSSEDQQVPVSLLTPMQSIRVHNLHSRDERELRSPSSPSSSSPSSQSSYPSSTESTVSSRPPSNGIDESPAERQRRLNAYYKSKYGNGADDDDANSTNVNLNLNLNLNFKNGQPTVTSTTIESKSHQQESYHQAGKNQPSQIIV